MLRSQLRNRLNRHNTSENWNGFKKQRNRRVKILRRAKTSYYGNLDINSVTDSKKFWKTVKPLFTDKPLQVLRLSKMKSLLRMTVK